MILTERPFQLTRQREAVIGGRPPLSEPAEPPETDENHKDSTTLQVPLLTNRRVQV